MKAKFLLFAILALRLAAFAQEASSAPSEPISTQFGDEDVVGNSVNGFGAFTEMVKAAWHEVEFTDKISASAFEKAECIIWFDGGFGAPKRDVTQPFDDWLEAKPGRTLIYIGRDYDASPLYWRLAGDLADPEERDRYREIEAAARSRFEKRREALRPEDFGTWFRVRKLSGTRRADSIEGAPEWTADVDPSQLEISWDSYLEPNLQADIRLSSGGQPLVSSFKRGEGRVILVNNGSFLLNLPLAIRENRKLAGALIDEIGPPKRVLFPARKGPREAGGAGQSGGSGKSGGSSGNSDGPPPPDSRERGEFDIFGTPPFDWPLAHLAILGALFCLARFPIFGRPKEDATSDLSDFGRHITALGKLLQGTQDSVRAHARLARYRESIRGKAAGAPRVITTSSTAPGASAPAPTVTAPTGGPSPTEPRPPTPKLPTPPPPTPQASTPPAS